MPGIVGLKDLIERYFSSNLWLGIFIAATIYLLFRMNTPRKRALLAALVFFFLFVNKFVIKQFTALGENGTFYRHLWAIPSMVVVGIAMVDLIRILPRWFLKIPAIVGLSLLLWFVYNNEYVRCREQGLSVNAGMVSDDVVELGDGLEELRKQTDKETLFIVCPRGYERNYGNLCTELSLINGNLKVTDSSVLNDSKHNGESELTGDLPDVSYILSTCCSKGMDYVIILRNEGVEGEFRERGHNPSLVLSSYFVYKCCGFSGYSRDENRYGKITRRSYYDEDGSPATKGSGYSTIKYLYDEKMRNTRIEYLDGQGQPVEIDKGYATIDYKYFEDNSYTKTYSDIDGNPVQIYGRFSTKVEKDNRTGRVYQTYLNKDGNVEERLESKFAGKNTQYNDKGKVVEEAFLDKEGKPVDTYYGYASYVTEYDQEGLLEQESYYDANGRLLDIAINDRPSGTLMKYLHSSEGFTKKGGHYLFTTATPDCYLYAVQLQIWDAKTDRCVAIFGTKDDEGDISGEYCHEFNTGLYYIRVKGHTGVEDEWFRSLVYLEEGTVIRYRYHINILDRELIDIDQLSFVVE